VGEIIAQREQRKPIDRAARRIVGPLHAIRNRGYDLNAGSYPKAVPAEVNYQPPKMVLVARQLGGPNGTVITRLASARALLPWRLRIRGLCLAGGVLAAELTGSFTSAAPVRLVEAKITAAQGQTGGAPPGIALTKGARRTCG
jgi:hypothetical protein